MPSTRALIHAPWSASKVAAALRCPRLFHFKYVERVPEPEVMPEARIGKAIHAALEEALLGLPAEAAATKARAKLTDESEQLRFDAVSTAPSHSPNSVRGRSPASAAPAARTASRSRTT